MTQHTRSKTALANMRMETNGVDDLDLDMEGSFTHPSVGLKAKRLHSQLQKTRRLQTLKGEVEGGDDRNRSLVSP